MVTNPSRGVENANKRLCFLVRGLDGGGAQRDAILLANELQKNGIDTAIVTLQSTGPLNALISPDVPVIDLGDGAKVRLAFAGPAIRRLLVKGRPTGVVSAEAAPNALLAMASRFVPKRSRPWIILREAASPVQARLNDPYWQNRLAYRLAPKLYPMADVVMTLTEGARTDLIQQFSVPAEKIVNLGTNAVITPEIRAEIEGAIRTPEPGHIFSVGRLSPEKGFLTLIEAFALLRKQRPVKLTIVGEGAERQNLEAKIAELGVSGDVDLPGHHPHPIKALSRAALFVSSSSHEGLGNAIIEAMACGIPVVCTDAPHGPREILEGGRLGPLVSVGDAGALAEAMARTLDDQTDINALRQRAMQFSVERAAQAFEDVLSRMGLKLRSNH
ncbi:glycosyltransferase [Neorhizobium sp. JUb45]|uniref:glycosyltransferase n=1 Tax=unclassified Neorhizobium TaxID=2629175 RepID=UPI0010D1EBA3|nr:glycosyltransferase [Neorhizobium sp. JUb45]TCR00037.1 glycosyltransferase involved in cell wall biosynthesis [Neorhizobium sp. JUb45]